MASLDHVIAYVVRRYPYKDDLSNARLTKMIYLADWYNAKNRKRPVTNIRWYYDNYGPFVWDIYRTARESPIFKIRSSRTIFGHPKDIIEVSDEGFEPELTTDEKNALDHVIEETKDLGWAPFIQLIYATYPVASSSKYTHLNLERLANDYESLNSQSRGEDNTSATSGGDPN
jgi:hypothetical protein